MSKGSSHLFSGTSGEGKALIHETLAKGKKISSDKVVLIAREPSGKIVWLETGNDRSGLKHIIDKHGHQFNGQGISNDDIPNFVLEALHQGNVVGTQGKRNPRTVYEFIYRGKKYRIAIQVSENGYIVSANPRSNKE